MSSAGLGPLCFLKPIVNTDIYQNILELLPSANKLYGDFIFQQDLPSLPKNYEAFFDAREDNAVYAFLGLTAPPGSKEAEALAKKSPQ
uniref:SH3 domain binding glutamic acid-rich protein like n=1 Tax=Nothobranchius kuhntae TaxID=321403 RepID=A0A1A8IKN8_NOTKU